MQKFLNTTHRSVIWFKKTFDAGDLVIKPPFQRNPVWSLRQQSSLIDTILLEYPIPEIYMQELTDTGGNQKHVLVDGQQRIRTVLSFLSGEFELEEESPGWAGLSFEDLSGPDRKKIFEYNFVVRLLPEIPEEEVRTIFQRLNKNTTVLNAQELRHATYWGPFIKLMEDISDWDFWSESAIFSANDRRRMLDTEFISELAVAVLNGLQNKKKQLEEFYQQYETSFDGAESLRSLFLNVLGEIWQILPNIAKTRWRKKSDFYTLFVTFGQYSSQLPLSADKRELASQALVDFGAAVDKAISAELDANVRVETTVADYVRNVERAASDLGSRQERERVLKEVLAGVF
ncbi:MAG: DUF262 domain-containing protein [Candidatus Acidiferrales bacterium]